MRPKEEKTRNTPFSPLQLKVSMTSSTCCVWANHPHLFQPFPSTDYISVCSPWALPEGSTPVCAWDHPQTAGSVWTGGPNCEEGTFCLLHLGSSSQLSVTVMHRKLARTALHGQSLLASRIEVSVPYLADWNVAAC